MPETTKEVQNEKESEPADYPQIVSKKTVQQVFIFTMLIAAVPFFYFAVKKKYFEEYLNYNDRDSAIPAGMTSLVVLHLILAIFVYLAYTEKIPSKPKAD